MNAGSVPAPANQIPFLDLGAMHADDAAELRCVFDETVRTSAFIGGPAVERFEEQWAAYCGTRYAVGLANGTDSLALALRALGIGPGDEVIVPTATFIATAEAVVMAGATPVFADVDDDTLLITADHIAALLTPRTAAVIVVHLYGHPVDLGAITALTERAGIALIEDAAQAHGARWGGTPVGGFGTAGSFSFYPGKNLGALGDGGAFVTNDAALAASVRSFANHGRAIGSHHDHDRIGVNSRLDGLQAALLSIKLARLDGWVAARRAVADIYRTGLLGSGVSLVDELPGAYGAWHLAVIRHSERDRLRELLGGAGVATGLHYPMPCHQLGPYRQFATGPLPVAERAAAEVLSLPMFPHLGSARARAVCDALHAALATVGPSRTDNVEPEVPAYG